MSFYELRKKIEKSSAKLEGFIVSFSAPDSSLLDAILSEMKSIYEEALKIDAFSEYLIVDKHIVCQYITRVLLLIKILSPEMSIDMNILSLQRNMKPSFSDLSAKDILIESVYLYILSNKHAQNIIEVVHTLKNKIQIKQVITNEETEFDLFMLKKVELIVEERAKELLPITQSSSVNDLSMALKTVLEISNIKYAEDFLLQSNVHSSVEIRSILRQLILIESIEIDSDTLEIYHLVLKLLLKYIEMKKARDFINSKYVIYEILDDDCVSIMTRILEKENIPCSIRSEIMNILIASDIQSINYMNTPFDNSNPIPYIRYIVKNTENREQLMEMLEFLEIEITDDGNAMEISNLVAVMDFLCIILYAHTTPQRSQDSGLGGNTAHFFLNSTKSDSASGSENGNLILEKYIGNSIVEVYNRIVPSFLNPLVVYCYLSIFTRLTRTDKSEFFAESRYFGNANGRNALMAHSINVLGMILKQLSAYIVQEDMVYTEMPVIDLYDLNSPYSSIRIGDVQKKRNIVMESVQMLFDIIRHLPEPIRNTVNPNYVLNIVFRVVCVTSDSIPRDLVSFIAQFFSSSIINRLSNGLGNNLYSFISVLIRKNELEIVYSLILNSTKLYRGILEKDILTDELLADHKDDPMLYSILSTLFVHYYTDNSSMNNIIINKKIVQIYATLVESMKKSVQMVDLLKDSREFGYFFKILCVIGKALNIDCSDILGTILSKTGCGDTNLSKCELSLLYNSTSRNISELYYFYHFVYQGVDISQKLSMGKIEPGRDKGLLCISELNNSYSSNTLKYLSLLGLEGSDVKNPQHVQMYKDLDMSGLTPNERILFINQIYRALFLSGRIQLEKSSTATPLNISYLEAEIERSSSIKNSGGDTAEEKKGLISTQGTIYKYANMTLSAAIKATRDTGIPHTLPYSILAAGDSWLVSALLYTLYEKSPNSAIVLSYIKKMKKYTKDDGTVYSRVLGMII